MDEAGLPPVMAEAGRILTPLPAAGKAIRTVAARDRVETRIGQPEREKHCALAYRRSLVRLRSRTCIPITVATADEDFPGSNRSLAQSSIQGAIQPAR